MTGFSSGTLDDVFGGFLVYRNLIPVDDRLPTIGDLRSKLGMARDRLPRKAEPEYASVIGEILREARRLSGTASDASRLVFVGDTMHNDVSAFSNLCQAMGWQGRAFIADEGPSACRETRALAAGQNLTVSNQWSDVASFVEDGLLDGFGCDEGTMIVVDIDKTLLGARGRNDQVIDRARRQAAYEVARDHADESLAAEDAFARIYNVVNGSAFHPLTGDNQDAVAYVSLLVAGGMIDLEELTASVANGQIDGFRAFVNDLETRRSQLTDALAQLQQSVYVQVKAGNPTPFSSFRQAEYRCTTGLMGHLSNDASRETMLDEEIVITEEVWMAIKRWKAQGCVIFGLSDKPDEACFPPDTRVEGGLPIHLARTHIIGGRR
ncbi:hypothetical protein IH601_11235 [Candidatus Bipolaricaulota bacterium]|nr:hypothetical protein [Candidatus Bipolaricaulota bacterium]TFH11629.1 MAG: hypothetical protein E4H08_00780 [Candidatus Atribacteria bacterium]